MAKARGPGKMAGMRSASPRSRGMEAEKDRLCSESETRNRASALESTSSSMQFTAGGRWATLPERRDPFPSRSGPWVCRVHSENPSGVFLISPSTPLGEGWPPQAPLSLQIGAMRP